MKHKLETQARTAHLSSRQIEQIERHHELPAGSRWWAVRVGLQWGDLAGGETGELWLWDGREARFVEIYDDVQF